MISVTLHTEFGDEGPDWHYATISVGGTYLATSPRCITTARRDLWVRVANQLVEDGLCVQCGEPGVFHCKEDR